MSGQVRTLKEYLRTAFRWQRGRQGSGYDKMLLATSPWPVPFDCYLLRYPVGTHIPPHTDRVTGRGHYRLNLVLKPSAGGGDFRCEDPIVDTGRIKLFRPDLSEHSVSQVIGSARYVLSIGWLWGKGPVRTPALVPADIPPEIAEWLTEDQRSDPAVLEFLQRAYRAGAEEKQSDPDDWSDEERAAHRCGDWKGFSRLRGYTEEEIANFGEFMRLAHLLEARYGDDFALCLHYELDQLNIEGKPAS